MNFADPSMFLNTAPALSIDCAVYPKGISSFILANPLCFPFSA